MLNMEKMVPLLQRGESSNVARNILKIRIMK